MTRQPPGNPTEVAAHILIGHDVGLLTALFSLLDERNTAGDVGASWLTLTYLDWASLVAYEVRGLSRKGINIPSAQTAMAYEQQLANSRHSSKMLNNTEKSIEDQLQAFTSYAAQHREQLIDKTRAPTLIRRFRSLGRLQQDLGIALCIGNILSTTLSLRYHLGLEMDSSPAEVYARGEELGAFLNAIANDESRRCAARIVTADMTFPPVESLDARSADFFAATFDRVGVAESMMLSAIACRLRATLVMGGAAHTAGTDVAMLSFKFRFVVTWQLASTLRTILDNPVTFALPDHLTNDLRQLQDTESVAAMADQGLRWLRNTLIHYRVDKRAVPQIDWDDPLLGLSQALCDGRTWQELDALTAQAGVAIMGMLDRWRGPFDHLLSLPF